MHGRHWVLCSLLALACNRGPAAADAAATPPAGGEAEGAGTPEPDPLAAEDPAKAPLRLVEVAPGVHAALQPEALRFNDCNAALLVTEAGVAVIDPPQRVAAMQWLRRRADALAETSGAAKRRVLVTTHWHLDHSLGGSLWRAEALAARTPLEHWGHAGLPPLLAVEGKAQLHEHRVGRAAQLERGHAMKASGRLDDGTPLTPAQQLELDGELVELGTELDALARAELLPPDHPVASPTTVALGSLTLELIPVRAHTDADLVVHIPEAGVLITGDVLDEIPFGGHGRPRHWVNALRRLRELEATTIIPGHGAVLGPDHLDRTIALWDALLEQARLAIQRGETPSLRWDAWAATPEHQALRAALISDPRSERAFAAFIPEALARAMADLRGDLDAPPAGR
jgi:glyoxylase-like metal-dependent hydrolase (beta-lactamase superfamily II)